MQGMTDTKLLSIFRLRGPLQIQNFAFLRDMVEAETCEVGVTIAPLLQRGGQGNKNKLRFILSGSKY